MEIFGLPGPDKAPASALESFQIESKLEFSHGCIEVRQYTWLRATTDVWSSDDYFLHVCMTPRPGRARAIYLDVDQPIPEEIGRMMLIPPHHRMHIGGSAGTQKSLSCAFTPALIEGILKRRPNWHRAALSEGLHLNSPEVEWFLLKMYRELRQPGFATQMMAESLANGLAIALIRAFKLDGAESRSSGGLAPWRMRLIRERVHADLPPPQLSELAALCRVSVRHLSRAFKIETGQTIAEFTSHTTIERACRLLGNSDLSIREIATRLGFSSSASFAYAFRRAVGSRPGEFRDSLGFDAVDAPRYGIDVPTRWAVQ